MNLSKKVLLSAFFIVLLIGLANNLAEATVNCSALANLSSKPLQSGVVAWVVDGDTLHTTSGRKLRLLHINAPELNPGANKPIEYYANQSRSQLVKFTPKGSKIFWIHDKQSKDHYGRELVLIFDQNKNLVNLELVRIGAASTLIVPPNEVLWQCFKSAQKWAERSKQGFWKSPKLIKKQAKKLTNEKRFQWISGRITNVINSKKYRWIVLDDKLWIGIKRKDFSYFLEPELRFTQGNSISVGGYLYHSYGRLRMNLRHPAMLFRQQ